ncbi:uncharacterized protein LOC127265735 isoform X2 [Andrographis paniculata]|uniref:uncharacterized protein LOC127265735 isoform X2 n=1 Tax=Andrographis paniculata TaxID=175694 RepID=UPI0021E8E285|nr:uncharacterized protein LOC127265735 isoform X2 [Andrographis paniculata]
MFRSALWRSEKHKFKVEFKLQFRAAKVPHVGEDALVISVVPADYGKATVKSDKAAPREGNCFWENPVYETVKFSRDPKSGKIQERIYHFVVGTGLSSKAGVIGEASIDLSSYAEATKASLVSLPLKNTKTEAVLHVSIQRMQETHDQRGAEEIVDTKLDYKDHSLKAHLDDGGIDGIMRSNSEDMPLKNEDPQIAEVNGNRRRSSGSDVTMSSSESSSGVEIPWQHQMHNDGVHQEPSELLSPQKPQVLKTNAQTPIYKDNQRSQWEWLQRSTIEASTDDSSSTPSGNSPRQDLVEASDVVIDKLKSDVAVLSRQVEMSELELQTLRRQIVKESRTSQDLMRELVSLKEERDALNGECERLRSSQRRLDDTKTKPSLQFEGGDSKAIIQELRQELHHAKELNSNLRLQLQKTQESNSELLLAVRDLDELLEEKNKEILSISSGSSAKYIPGKLHEEGFTRQPDDVSDDNEQKALEELVKVHGVPKEVCHLEKQIRDMHSEIEIYKRDKDDLEMQLEQLALDYEILKQQNHEMVYKLEQSELQEQLKLQYECSYSYEAACELESQIENLENELKTQSKESAGALVKISELEAHVCSLEEELERQSKAFEADLDDLMRSKVEQEQRAIKAEETLRKTRWQNANTAERIQDEFKRLSVQMASTLAANEKVAHKALAEANELRLHKICLEEMIHKAAEEHQSVKESYEARLHQLENQVMLMTNQIKLMQSEIDDKVLLLENQKKQGEETQKLLSVEISKLKNEIEMCMAKNKILLEEIEGKDTLMHQLDQMRASFKEMEFLWQQGNGERTKLENRIRLTKSEAEELQEELNKMRCLMEEKESIAVSLKAELDTLHSQFTKLQKSASDGELEKEKLRGQVLSLETELKKMESAINHMEKIIKDADDQDTAHCSDEGQIKLKESALEASSKAFLEKEMELQSKIAELEGRLEVLNESNNHSCEKATELVEDQNQNVQVTVETCSINKFPNTTNCGAHSRQSAHDTHYIDELKQEVALLKERNESMEEELKEMQGRYSEISLKFAEVEGERQQLVMKVRKLKNAKKRS